MLCFRLVDRYVGSILLFRYFMFEVRKTLCPPTVGEVTKGNRLRVWVMYV